MDRKTSNSLVIVLILIVLLLVGSATSAMITLSNSMPYMLQQNYLRVMNRLQPPVSLALPRDYL